MHILLCLWGIHPKLISGDEKFGSPYENPLFFATFITSLISASKGIASFLLEGPCKLLPKKGLFGGMGTMGFIFLCLNVTFTIVGKGFLLGIAYSWAGNRADVKVVLYWACFNVLPQFILVS